MSDKTHIQWCDATFNPWIGCTKVSPGCANCYAEKERATSMLGVKWGKDKERHRTSAGNWKKPLLWNRVSNGADKKRPRVFCASLADWLDDEVPIEWLADLLKLIHETPHLDWLLLTKRPENFWKRVPEAFRCTYTDPDHRPEFANWLAAWIVGDERTEAPMNAWFGVSVEDQARAEERIPQLLKIPARVRFLSVEPLLGPVDFDRVKDADDGMGLCWDWAGKPTHIPHCDYAAIGKQPACSGIHWVIVGGESGPKARPCNIEWVRSIVSQCRAAGVAPFVKQFGGNTYCDNANLFDWPEATRLKSGGCLEGASACYVDWRHPKGGDMSEWPEDLRVREFPE